MPLKLVLLDRDGVINEDPSMYVTDPADWIAYASSLSAIARLNAAGLPVAVCTNQSGVGRGLMSAGDLQAVHARMTEEMAEVGARLDGIFSCMHGPSDDCQCRKPAPGLLIAALEALEAPPQETCFVGDSIRDVAAALAAACTPILVRTGKGAQSEREAREMGVIWIFDDLAGAADWIISQ